MTKKNNTLRSYDILIAVLLGAIFTVISAWFVSPYLISASSKLPYIAPNFGEYCEYLGLWDVQDAPQKRPQSTDEDSAAIDFMHPGRRTMTGSIPGRMFLSQLGVIDALGAGALLCSTIFAASLYLWTTALYGRLAGFISVVAALSTGSLSLISRHFTFYPTIVASFA